MKNTLINILFLVPIFGFSQLARDTTLRIAPVQINTYFNDQPFLQHTSSAKVVTKDILEAQMPGDLVSAVNTVPGLRMEERSPGSYRIALRGSMLRSPFGVRNTKIYIDEIPFTDAGGNTYINLIDPVGIADISILKGPDGSLFGPNSGGVIRIAPNGLHPMDPSTSLLLSGGSFGTWNQQLHHSQHVSDTYQFSFDQAFMRSDGYRDNTALNKKYFQTGHQWRYSPKGTLKLLALYTDLEYGTPGGLTQAQFEENPQQARPATPTMPGAMEQQAAIRNKTLLSGLTHQYRFDERWTHSATLFGSVTDFTNPFITNYENRDERNIGVRTYLSYTDNSNTDLKWQMQVGLEAQKGRYQVDNYDNNAGEQGQPQSLDRLENGQTFYFYRASTLIFEKLTIEGSIGLNFNNIYFEQQFPVVDNPMGEISFGNTWMPRLAASYLLNPQIAVRTSVSKGYSPPTIAEVRSSDNQINSTLRPETGTNYEVGLRGETQNRRFLADISVYQYRMADGIIRQQRENGAEYFVNAGEIAQRGLELMLMSQVIAPTPSAFVQSLRLSSNLTYQDYTFDRYRVDDEDHSGNKVTSIPDWIWVNTAMIAFPKGVALNLMHNFTSSIPLDDANSTFADKYHLVQAKLHWTTPLTNKWSLQLFLGVDNLLNRTYSLGNDINAFGGRFFNPAPTRNFYGGVKVEF